MTPTVMVGITISRDCSQSLDDTKQSSSERDGDCTWLLIPYLARNGLSFQEADGLYEWAAAVLHEDATGQEANIDISSDLLVAGTTIEGPEWSLKYYEERAEQGGSQLEFRDIKSLPSDTLSLLRVEEAARYLPAPPQKKKHHSHCKMMDTDEEDSYSSFSKDSLGSDNGGLP
ncbi:hypothetical protein SCLCIDRAFT_24435 [Scleroderma citrinum Foug A]|uniref:Uncharacterized protein n=1 Tax=Scleroderma citrinum Foug A TaxID=1036808 RepID=A0A0C3DRL5_9AGAM|nr:hypothetical protein SCLCIDRAFT_24435 [Scleroderma citrinum Foug A]